MEQRIACTPADHTQIPDMQPFSLMDSKYPEDLWHWLDKTTSETGAEFLAIAHNSNLSKGYMFPEVTVEVEPVSVDYAALRAKWEPIVAITQTKGNSETIGALAPTEEFADYEIYPHYLEPIPTPYKPARNDFVRSALKQGREIDSPAQMASLHQLEARSI